MYAASMLYQARRIYDWIPKRHLLIARISVLAIVISLSLFLFYPRQSLKNVDKSKELVTARLDATHVPEVGEKTSDDVAAPIQSFPAAPYSPLKFRSFDLSIKKDKLSNNSIIVNKGDTVNMSLSAVDVNYTVSIPDYGLLQNIAKWSTRVLQFQANQSGIFDILSGWPESRKIGEVLIK